jgi:hypothetical protein
MCIQFKMDCLCFSEVKFKLCKVYKCFLASCNCKGYVPFSIFTDRGFVETKNQGKLL